MSDPRLWSPEEFSDEVMGRDLDFNEIKDFVGKIAEISTDANQGNWDNIMDDIANDGGPSA